MGWQKGLEQISNPRVALVERRRQMSMQEHVCSSHHQIVRWICFILNIFQLNYNKTNTVDPCISDRDIGPG